MKIDRWGQARVLAHQLLQIISYILVHNELVERVWAILQMHQSQIADRIIVVGI